MSEKRRARQGSHRDALEVFHPAVRAWFRDALGAPTAVQERAWPEIAAGKTTLMLAPTGSGKTLAAFLAAIDRLSRAEAPHDKERLRVLYVSPLKALAVDIERNLRAPLAGIAETSARMGEPLRRLEVGVRTGDTPSAERLRLVRKPPDILITTPESLYLLLTSRQREILASVDTVILDEIHQMAASKRGAHLTLSLERLEALRGDAPLQRIGLSATQRPLEEIARFLAGFEVRGKHRKARPVEIVDASAKKALSIQVESPPPIPGAEQAPGDPESSVEGKREGSTWPQVHARLVERIRAARSTMIFVNSRRLAERLATALNETAEEEIALAHHGSVAKEKRQVLEERLKAGDLPAIVATSSLELGIDMGAVDQVIQVEAPPSVASGIQRIGRASHHVGGVPTGVIIPKHKHDLLACAAAAASIEAGEVEETYYPRNALDVLAQQIVAIAAVGLTREVKRKATRNSPNSDQNPPKIDVDAIWDRVRQAAPFVDLPRASFEGVLDMLAGRYPSDEFADLRPRITWDRTRGTISGRAGAQRLAILNAGTIPDRGLYGVFLDNGGSEEGVSEKAKPSRRVGELDEEMVFELREGEVFLLGASSWRAEKITRDRVLVSPAAGIPGKMPFWHGDRLGRSAAFGKRIGELTRKLATLPQKEALEELKTRHHLDARSAEGLTAYVREEIAAVGAVPTERNVVVERVTDELGDLRICVMSPFGSRIHAPWAMAVLRRLREARAGDIEAVWTDDGMVFRVPGGEAPPDDQLLFPRADEIEDLVTRELQTSSLFAARFREAAARALLLPRQLASKRTPLWAQRKRAADLLSVASQYPSFPIVLETYRECLRDAFDLPGLIDVLDRIEKRQLKVTTVDATFPSPFASSLLFSFVGNFLYDEDAPAQERRAQALTIDFAQLKELLGEGELRKLLDPDVVAEHAWQLQRRDRPLRHADALSDLLLWLGDQSRQELEARAPEGELDRWLSALRSERRLVEAKIAGEVRFIAVEDAARYRDALGVVLPRGLPDVFLAPSKDPLMSLIARFGRTHGPFRAADVAARFGIGEASALQAIESLVARRKVVSGAFSPRPVVRDRAYDALEYCDAEVLRALRQKTLARLRKAIEPVSGDAFARFLIAWHGVHASSSRAMDPVDGVLDALGALEGFPIPASVLETEVLPARVPGFQPYHLDALLASGEVVWAGIEPIGSHDGRVALYRADREVLLARPPRVEDAPQGELHGRIRALLEQRGAIFFAEMGRHLGGFPQDLLDALWDLVWAGEVTNDTFESVRQLVRHAKDRRPRRHGTRTGRRVHAGPAGSEGRWSLRRARWDQAPSPAERGAALATNFLERYGVVLREAPRAEGLSGGFSALYDVLRAMEERGRVRRGYFVAGRGATQFALPGAEERLRGKPDAEGERVVVLSATDPANPYGAVLPWPEGGGRTAQRAPGAHVILLDGALVAWVSRGGGHVSTFFSAEEPARAHAIDALATGLGVLASRDRRATAISTIDDAPAPDSDVARALLSHRFALRGGALFRFFDREGAPADA